MAKIDEVKDKLIKLSKYVPLAEKLEISKPWQIPENYIDNTNSYPDSEYPGVYLFTDANLEIIYIGKASSGLGARIGGEYLGKEKVKKSNKILKATFLYTIRLDWEIRFLAPALEEFLIRELDPSGNVIGKSC